MKLSVIIPVYNEEHTIDTIIGRVRQASLPAGVTREVVIVNDGSTDSTTAKLAPYRSLPDFKVFDQPNQGKAAAVITGIQNATGEIFIIQDADLEYDPNDYQRLIGPILKGEASVVYGSRFTGRIEGMTLINRLANNISNLTFHFLYGAKITDLNTCYKTIKMDAVSGMKFHSQHFGFDAEVTAKLAKKGYKIFEVPINYKARTVAEGKKINWSHAIKLYWVLIKLRFTDK